MENAAPRLSASLWLWLRGDEALHEVWRGRDWRQSVSREPSISPKLGYQPGVSNLKRRLSTEAGEVQRRDCARRPRPVFRSDVLVAKPMFGIHAGVVVQDTLR